MARSERFHEGELEAQRNAREQESAARNGANVVDYIIRGAVPFVRQQSALYVGSVDGAGRVWASMLFGAPGFVQPSEDGHALLVDLDQVALHGADPLWDNLRHDDRLGLLLMDTQSRRRLKVNGRATLAERRLRVQVEESVPVCPRYIQRRAIAPGAAGLQSPDGAMLHGAVLGAAQLETIARADTFFLASAHATHGADCSHRGGKPGFVRVKPDGVLRIPDYDGNSMFNSIGNLLRDPRAGLLFPDYERRVALQLSGRAAVFWDQPDDGNATGGTGRFWEFTPDQWRETALPASLQVGVVDYSPFLPNQG